MPSYDSKDIWWQSDFAETVRNPLNFDRRWLDPEHYQGNEELESQLLDGRPQFESHPSNASWCKTGRMGHIYLIIYKRSNKIYVGQTLVGCAKRWERHIVDAFSKKSEWGVHQYMREVCGDEGKNSEELRSFYCIAYKTVCLPALTKNTNQLQVWTKMMTEIETEFIQEFSRKMPQRLLNQKQRKAPIIKQQSKVSRCTAAAPSAPVAHPSAAAKAILEQAMKQDNVEVMRALIQSALTLM
jgi:hypothetical protein